MRKRMFITIAILVAAFCVCAGGYTMVMNDRAASEQQAAAKVEAEKQAVSELQDELDAKASASLSEATGVDTERIAHDRNTVESIARAALTWDDSASYEKSRQTILDLGVPEDSEFMTQFMKPVETVTNGHGAEMNSIDMTNAQTKFSTATTYCRGFDGDVYSYACVAVGTSSSGSATQDTSYIFTCSIDGAGAISDMRAIQVD